MKARYDRAMAAGADAGTRQMKQAGREEWNEEDWEMARAVFEQIMDGRPE